MSIAITIRSVPIEVRNELAGRAARSGRSLQEFLLAQLIEMTSRPTLDEVVTRARDRVARTGTVLDSNKLLTDRDADRK